MTATAGVALEWMSAPGIHQFYLGCGIFCVNSWCWTLFVLYVDMRYLDFTNKWLVYGRETMLPFYLLRQPVVIVIALVLVQWDAGIPLKLLVVVLGSLLVTLGLVELVIKRVNVLRRLFGMKSKPA
jgi:surface polysaccharide O-acyltransferase-like enzyme